MNGWLTEDFNSNMKNMVMLLVVIKRSFNKKHDTKLKYENLCRLETRS
jgi:hypothetical protein